jgi:predicted PhzF superfamily epimerase YddE/YHI9
MHLTLVDAFTDRPFGGNPAAVAVLEQFPPEELMAAVAAELNLSETAFCVARPDGDHDLRWFTPSVEVNLCGHATLATAHVLARPARFHTRSGPLSTSPAAGGSFEMEFPAGAANEITVAAGTAEALGAAVVRAAAGPFLLAELADAAAVRDLRPRIAAVAGLHPHGVIVTAPGDRPGIDCVSRVFAPNAGIDEDPVTGSAHCQLATWWGRRTGCDELVGEQASRRGGTVSMRRLGDRVLLGGRAVTVGTVTLDVEDERGSAPRR